MMRLGLAITASLTLASGAQAVTVVNGSFELGAAIPAGSIFVPTNNTTSIFGWKVLSTGVDYVDSSLWDASTGNRSVELSGTGAGGLTQRLVNQFVVGKNYVINFRLSANPFGPDKVYKAIVSATGGVAQSFSYTETAANTPTNMLYQDYKYIFTASGVSQNIQFRSVGAGPYGVVLDNVSIGLVPEPANWALLIAGFGMIGLAMRRRRLGAVAA